MSKLHSSHSGCDRGISPIKGRIALDLRCIYCVMEFRQLGQSGLKVPVLSFGTGTFGGGSDFFRAWGSSDVKEATRLVDICLEADVNLFDTADVYSKGLAEEILGKAIAGRRDKVLLSTKATFRMAEGQTNWDPRGVISSNPVKPACGGWAPTISTSTISTDSMRSRQRMKFSARSTDWLRLARYDT